MNLNEFLATNYIKLKRYYDGYDNYELIYENENLNLQTALIGKIYGGLIIKYLKSNTEKFKFDTNDKHYVSEDLMNIPAYIAEPPPLRTDIITYNTVLGYTPISPEFSYLQNFRVDVDFLDKTKLMYDHSNPIEVANNARRGQYKMFHNQLKTRGVSPSQCLWICLLCYRCNKCRYSKKDLIYYNTCHCYFSSSCIMTLMRLCGSHDDIPFEFSKMGEVVKKRSVSYMSSLIPSLWYALCDLCIRGRLCVFGEMLELKIVNSWLRSCKGSFHGSVLASFKNVKDTITKLRINREFVAPQFDAEFHITGSKKMYIEQSEGDVIKFSEYDSWLKTLHHDGDTSRDLIYQLQHVSPSILVTGSIELVLSGSAQATNPKNFLRQRISEYTDVGLDYRIPSKIDYEDQDIEEIRKIIFDEIVAHPPRLDNLEAHFIEVATTNSAGLSPEERQLRSEEITRMYGDNDDSTMIKSLSGVRLFDVLLLISESMQNWGQFIGSWNMPNSSGLRYQVGRRIRLIQMLRSVYMVSPFLIKQVLEPSIMASDIATSGKTTNDIRDSFRQCVATSISVRVNSDDVTGMDTSTHKFQTAFLTNIVYDYLLAAGPKIGNFFFTGQKDLDVTVHTVSTTGQTSSYQSKIPITAAIVLLDNYPSNTAREYRAGYFSTKVYSSNISFESGTYKTSIQHTRLLSAIYKIVRYRIMKKYNEFGLRLLASVLGDDQFSHLIGVATRGDLIKYSIEVKAMLDSLLAKFGYITDSTFVEGYGEFLKQVAICGVPIPFSVRLTQFSSERGEKGSIVDRIKNSFGVIDELSARVPNPQAVVGYKCCLAMVVGIFSLMQSRTKVNIKDLLIKNNLPHKWITSDIVMCTGRKIWYCALQIGVPLMKTKSHEQSTFLSFSSPASCRLLLDICKRTVITHIKMDVLNRIRKLPTIQKIYWKQVLRTRGKQFIQDLFEASDSFLPITMDEGYDMNILVNEGIYDGYMMASYSSGKKKQLDFGPGFKNLQRLGNSYLDRQLVNISHLSAYNLLNYGIRVPEAFVYYNRCGARLESVVETQHLTEGKLLAVSDMLLDMGNDKTLFEFMESLGYGAYSITKAPPAVNIVEYSCNKSGFGPCIPPGSIQSEYIDRLGLPKISDYDIESVRSGIESMMNIPGVSDVMLKFLGDCYNRGGINALNLALDSIAIPIALRRRVYKLLDTIGFNTITMPYSMNPRKFFYYCTTPYSNNLVNKTPSNPPYNDKTEWAIYMSEIAADHSLLNYKVQIHFGVR